MNRTRRVMELVEWRDALQGRFNELRNELVGKGDITPLNEARQHLEAVEAELSKYYQGYVVTVIQ